MKKRILTLLLMLSMVMVWVPSSVFAAETASGTCGDNLTWILADGVLTISGTGPMYDYELGYNPAPWDELDRTITKIVIEQGVTTIGAHAFSGTYELKSAVIPEGIVSIGEGAFQASGLEDFTLPSTLTSIGYMGFMGIQATSITIPASVSSMGESVCSYCAYIEKFEVEAGNPILTTKDGVLFNITKTELYQYPAGKKDSSYTIPDSVATIKSEAFGNSNYLSEVNIHSGVVNIELYAFTDCYAVTRFNVNAGNPNYSTGPNGELMNKNQDTLIRYPIGRSDKTYQVPDGVKIIEDSAFRFAEFSAICLSDTVTEVKAFAFDYCYYLKKVDWASVKVISHCMFQECASLIEISIPASVERMEPGCFNVCGNLERIIFDGDAPEMGESYDDFGVFSGLTVKAYYPANNPTWTTEVVSHNKKPPAKSHCGNQSLSQLR